MGRWRQNLRVWPYAVCFEQLTAEQEPTRTKNNESGSDHAQHAML